MVRVGRIIATKVMSAQIVPMTMMPVCAPGPAGELHQRRVVEDDAHGLGQGGQCDQRDPGNQRASHHGAEDHQSPAGSESQGWTEHTAAQSVIRSRARHGGADGGIGIAVEQAEDHRYGEHTDDAAARPDAGNPGVWDQAGGRQADAVHAEHHRSKDADGADQPRTFSSIELAVSRISGSNHFSHFLPP